MRLPSAEVHEVKYQYVAMQFLHNHTIEKDVYHPPFGGDIEDTPQWDEYSVASNWLPWLKHYDRATR